MKSCFIVEKGTYYGYSLAVENNKVAYNIGFRPRGYSYSEGQFAIRIPCSNLAWKNILNRKKNNKVGYEFIITRRKSEK